MTFNKDLGALNVSGDLVGSELHAVAKAGDSLVIDLKVDLLVEAQGLVRGLGDESAIYKLVSAVSSFMGKPMKAIDAPVADAPVEAQAVVAADAPEAVPTSGYNA